MDMIAAEMCEVLNPMLALNKLTVFSNARHGGSCHSVTDNVIAADTTKYRNPLDKVLPEQEKLQCRERMRSTEDDDSSVPQENISSEPETISAQKLDQPKEYSNVVQDSKHPPSTKQLNTYSEEPKENNSLTLTATTSELDTKDTIQKCQKKILSRDILALSTEQRVTLEVAADNVALAAQDTVTRPKVQSSEISAPGSTTRVADRYNRNPRHATASPGRDRTRPRNVTLVKQNSSFRGALCCTTKTKTFPVTRHMSPMTPERERQTRLMSRRKQNSSSPNVTGQHQQRQRGDLHLNIELPEITADPASSSTHVTTISENNSSSVILLPVLPPMLKNTRKEKQSPVTRDISPSYSPTQFIENAARKVATYFSSTSNSPVSLADPTRRRTKSPVSRPRNPSGKAQSPSISMFSNDDSISYCRRRSANFRRANSTTGTSGSGTSPTPTRKIYQSGGKRCLSPTKSPHEPRKILAPSSPLNLTPQLACRQALVEGISASPPTEMLQASRKKAIDR